MDGEGARPVRVGQPRGRATRKTDRSVWRRRPLLQPHCEKEWDKIVSQTCASYPVCKELPGVGVLGLKDLVLKDFNGLIHLKISGKQVRLVARAAEQEEGRTANVREHGCHKDTDTMVLRLKLKDYKFVKFEKEFVKCSTIGSMFGAKGSFETQVMTLPAGLSTMMGPFTLTIRLALDARLTRNPQTGEWSAKHIPKGETAPSQGPSPHVCVRPISINTLGMKLGTSLIKVLTFGSQDIPKNIENNIYCWFKYGFAAPGSGLSSSSILSIIIGRARTVSSCQTIPSQSCQ